MATSMIRLFCVRRMLNAVQNPAITSSAGSWNILSPQVQAVTDFNQVRHYAARKFTREKKDKMKRANLARKGKGRDQPEVKKEFVPYKILLARSQAANAKKRSEYGKNLHDVPVDNVYNLRYYKWPTYTIEEAINMHREAHHPTMWNCPNALVTLNMELDLTLKKKNRFIEKIRSLIQMPHYFELRIPRKVLVICARPEEVQQANAAGAHIVGGLEIVKQIQSGEIPLEEFDYCVSTPDLLQDLIPLKGVLKRNFPNRAKGNLGFDITQMVDYFARGVEYKSSQDDLEPEYGFVEIPIGKLEMPIEHLEKNIEAAIKEVCTHRAPELGPFVRQAYLKSPPTKECFNIVFENYLPSPKNVDESNEKEQELAAAS